MTTVPPEERFFTNMKELSSVIYDLVCDMHSKEHVSISPMIINGASKIMFDNYTPKSMIEGFITNSHHFQCFGNGKDPRTGWCKEVAKYSSKNGGLCEIHKGTETSLLGSFKGDHSKQPLQWSFIKKRDEAFMADNAFRIFTAVPQENIKIFRELFEAKDSKGNYIVGDIWRKQIWSFLDTLVKPAIHYIHENRKPYTVTKDGKVEHHYRERFYHHIDVIALAKEWGLNLRWDIS